MQKVRFGQNMHWIFGDIHPNSYASYIMMKNVYRLKDAAKHSKRLKQLFFNQDFLLSERDRVGNLTCCFCGQEDLRIHELFSNATQNKSNMATADHFWPKGKGGPAFDTNNLVVSCYKCNNAKADKIFSIDTLIREEDRIKVSFFEIIL